MRQKLNLLTRLFFPPRVEKKVWEQQFCKYDQELASYPGHVEGGKSGLVSIVGACANDSGNFSRTSPIMDKLHVIVSLKQRRGPKMQPRRVQQSRITTPTGTIPNAYNGYLRIPGPQRWFRIILMILVLLLS